MDEILPVRFPHTLGLDLAGTVVDHGPGVEDPAIGTEVIGFLPMTGPGAGAEYVTASASTSRRRRSTLPRLCLVGRPCGRGRLSCGWASAENRVTRNRKAQG
ncbi:hypothetical protein A5787_08850 [Mycobacterium sp. 852002-50816_SCH5313054-b]|nr:hypothetical protein A5787_08850 [Mycobacterium sp. 852002-50816_SCH5313054-b]